MMKDMMLGCEPDEFATEPFAPLTEGEVESVWSWSHGDYPMNAGSDEWIREVLRGTLTEAMIRYLKWRQDLCDLVEIDNFDYWRAIREDRYFMVEANGSVAEGTSKFPRHYDEEDFPFCPENVALLSRAAKIWDDTLEMERVFCGFFRYVLQLPKLSIDKEWELYPGVGRCVVIKKGEREGRRFLYNRGGLIDLLNLFKPYFFVGTRINPEAPMKTWASGLPIDLDRRLDGEVELMATWKGLYTHLLTAAHLVGAGSYKIRASLFEFRADQPWRRYEPHRFLQLWEEICGIVRRTYDHDPREDRDELCDPFRYDPEEGSDD